MATGSLVAVPELQAEGLARLLAQQGNTLTIRFLASGAEMTQEAKRVARFCLLPGTRVQVIHAGAPLEGSTAAKAVLRDQASGLLVYPVALPDGREVMVREDAIMGVPAPADPLEQLVTAAFHDIRPGGGGNAADPWGPATFCAREELMQWQGGAWSTTGGVVGFAGARVTPLPHQLLTARRVLADRQVRFLLADEVGLGKTIEAGLIVQSLLATRPQLRVLIVVPGALVSQWFLELFVKFGGRSFLMLDHERLRSYAGNPWKDEQFVLASSRALEEMEPKAALRLAQSEWDVLIVDECHRMQPGGVLAKRLAILSKSTPHVLLLSATPARSHPDAYLALLALLQPQVYRSDDLAGFAAKVAAYDRVVTLMAATKDAVPAQARELATGWTALLGADPQLAALAGAFAAAAGARVAEAAPDTAFSAAQGALLAHVREHYQLDQRIIRHRRQVLARLSHASGVKGLDLTTRSAERVPYSPDAPELAVRAALRAYQDALLTRFREGSRKSGAVPPRLAHWLLQLELASAATPHVLDRLLAMRAAVLDDPGEFADYRARAIKGESTAHVLRNDLSENEIAAHVAVSAACHAEPAVEAEVLAALRAAVAAWAKKAPARAKALIARLKRFWADSPDEKVLVFTAHGLAVSQLAELLADAFGDGAVETFGAHQDTVGREEAARRFREDDKCPLLICDPLGGEGRNFQFVSVVAHHDLPWSVAAVEQRIGRVDRLGRDGDVPSWVLAGDHEACVDGAWAAVLERAVGVFTASSSGLEFICDALETRALDAVYAGGATALNAALPELATLVAAERDARDARADELFHEEAATYAEAARTAQEIAAVAAPKEAVTRWIRGMGGSARRDDEGQRSYHLRTRFSHNPDVGVFERDAALARPDLKFFAPGDNLIDRLLDDASRASWCRASAWRRQPVQALERWEGLRVGYELVLDLAPLAAAGLALDSLRRLLLLVPPRRFTGFVRTSDAQVETAPGALAVLATPFDQRRGDSALSLSASREIWTRPFLAGKVEQVAKWQDEVRRAHAVAAAHALALLPEERDAALARCARSFDASLAAARAQAATAAARFGAKHADTVRATAEAAEEERQTTALRAALVGAKLEIASLAYLVVA